MYTGGDVRGEDALRVGLADRVVAPEELRGAAHAFAAEIAASGPLAVMAIRETMRGDLADACARRPTARAQEQARLRATDDFREGVAASGERRPPRVQWTVDERRGRIVAGRRRSRRVRGVGCRGRPRVHRAVRGRG